MENKVSRIIYNNSPNKLRSLFASIYGWKKNRGRYSNEFGRWYEYFSDNIRLSHTELVELQNREFLAFIQNTIVHIDYYSELFNKNNIAISDIKSISDLYLIPILEKDLVKSNPKAFINPKFSKIIHWKQTSGSTGKPMMVPWYAEGEQMEWGFLWARARLEVKRKHSYSSFTGLEIFPPNHKKLPFWIENWTSRQRMYSIFHMSDDNLFSYFEKINSSYNDYFSGYASAMYVLADFMLRHNLKLSKEPLAFYNSSEEMQPLHRETIEKAFNCKARDHYGQVELVGSITEYPCGHLHYDMDYSLLEFEKVSEDINGEIVAEIIATNFHNKVWPLLRYRTGDLVVYHPGDRCEHGFPGKVIRRIQGRTGMFFILPDGSAVTNISVIAKKCRNIKLMQVIQRKLGAIIIKIVKDSGYTDKDESNVLKEFRLKIGASIDIKVQYVDNINRASSGKYLSIINELNLVID